MAMTCMYRSMSWPTVARVRGLRCSSSWFSSRGQGLLRFALRLRAGRDRLGEVVPATAHRVGAGVHLHPQRPAGKGLDAATLAPRGSGLRRHDAMLLPTCAT